MSNTLEIAGRFNGPIGSGNGGYVAGSLAAFAEGPLDVSLRRPIPLDRPLDVRSSDGRVAAFDGGELIAEAEPSARSNLELAIPGGPISLDQAEAAKERYRGASSGVFATCFVCGRDREDGLCVHAGPVEGRALVASPWTPPTWCGGAEGSVRPEILWAVLDCPGYFATYRDTPDPLPIAFLARITARLGSPVAVDQPHIAYAWPISIEGRKRYAGSAIATAEGDVLAVAESLLIEPRPVRSP